MSNFSLSSKFDKNKVFIIKKNELDKRLDPFYYVPELVELENKVLDKKPKRLRDYVLSMGSGATPKTTESELYYSDAENGVPFLRVQNLSPTGVLEFEDCKYINQETHTGMLKRSQVFENDLLIKITGVGRMAVASVAPEGFEGNINQHIVVVKTESKEISETVAAFLNSDIGEKLASRRSTGGTRPALDYPALLSIPIIYEPKILDLVKKIVEIKKANEAKAEELLTGIDDYLLKELEIKLPEPQENTLKNRTFSSSIKELTGHRADPFYHQKKFIANLDSIKNGKYPVVPLINCVNNKLLKGILPKQEEKEGINKVIQINSINADGSINIDDLLTAKNIFLEEHKLKVGDILVVITGATIGKIAQWTQKGDYFLGGDIVKFQTNVEFDSSFVFYFLRSQPIQIEIKRNITGATNGHLSPEDIKTLPIPKVPLKKQQEIALLINNITEQAKSLKVQTLNEFKRASEKIEKIILDN